MQNNNLIEALTTSKSKTLAIAEFFESRSEHYIEHVNSIIEMIGSTDDIDETGQSVGSIMSNSGYDLNAIMTTSGGTFSIKSLLDTAISDIENDNQGKIEVTSANGMSRMVDIDEIVLDLKSGYHASISSAAALRAAVHEDASSRITTYNDYLSNKFTDVYNDLSGYSSSLSAVLRSSMDSPNIVDSVMEFIGFGTQDDDKEWFDEENFIDTDAYTGSSPIPAITFPSGVNVLNLVWEGFKSLQKANWRILKGLWKGVGKGVAMAGKFIKEVTVDPVDLEVINQDGDGTIEGFARFWRDSINFPDGNYIVNKMSNYEYSLIDEDTVSIDTVFATLNFRVRKDPLTTISSGPVFITVHRGNAVTTGFRTVKYFLENQLFDSLMYREEGNVMFFSLHPRGIEIETSDGDVFLWTGENRVMRPEGPLHYNDFLDGYWTHQSYVDPDSQKRITYDANLRLKPVNGDDIDLPSISGLSRNPDEMIYNFSQIASSRRQLTLSDGEVEMLKGYHYSARLLRTISLIAGDLARGRITVDGLPLASNEHDFGTVDSIDTATNYDFLQIYSGWDGNNFDPNNIYMSGYNPSFIDIQGLIAYFIAKDVERKTNPGDTIPIPFVKSDILGTTPTYRIKTDEENRKAFLVALSIVAILVVTITVGIPLFRKLRNASMRNQLKANQLLKTLQSESLAREITPSELSELRKQQKKASRLSRFIGGLRVPGGDVMADDILHFNPLGFNSNKLDEIDPKLEEIYKSIK